MPTVLVVDDSLSVRKVVEKTLQGRGIHVLAAASGREAIERIERERPDVVICDVVLPDKDGYQVCEFVRAHPAVAGTPILLISGVNDNAVRSRAVEVRSDDVMFKPFAADDLARRIDGLLAGANRGAGGTAPARAAAVEPAAPTAAAPDPSSVADGLAIALAGITATPGVRLAALVDGEGFLVDVAGAPADSLALAAALATCTTETSRRIGGETTQGALLGVILEYEHGLLLLQGVGAHGLLLVVLDDPMALGKARYCMRKAQADLQRLV
jgi:CheY-like chemotaxis protein